MLLTFTDFLAFKEMFLAYRTVGLSTIFPFGHFHLCFSGLIDDSDPLLWFCLSRRRRDVVWTWVKDWWSRLWSPPAPNSVDHSDAQTLVFFIQMCKLLAVFSLIFHGEAAAHTHCPETHFLFSFWPLVFPPKCLMCCVRGFFKCKKKMGKILILLSSPCVRYHCWMEHFKAESLDVAGRCWLTSSCFSWCVWAPTCCCRSHVGLI